jgi:hypothetical protein
LPKKVTKKGHQQSQLQNIFVAQVPTPLKYFAVRAFLGCQPHPFGGLVSAKYFAVRVSNLACNFFA